MDKILAETEKQEAREGRLRLAIENDKVAGVYELIAEEPELLDRVSKHPFTNTPLHHAAAAGKTQVAVEMAIMMPSFTQKLNMNGQSPMHLALQHGHYQTVRALMILDPNLIRVRGGGGITPLHFVAGEKGDNEKEKELSKLLLEFLSACKSSIEDLTNRRETAVHVAVKNHNLQAFKVLFEWLGQVSLIEILNWKDQDGNTVLHIAVLKKQPKIIKLLIGYTNVIAKNFQGETAMEIFRENPSGDQALAKQLRDLGCQSRFFCLKHLSQFFNGETAVTLRFRYWFSTPDESARNIIVGVATLIATATYQAALTPPGGYWQENSSNPPANSTVLTANSSGIAVDKPHQAGNVILTGPKLYKFTALNCMVFLVSIVTIWITAVPLLPRTLPVYFLTLLVFASFFATALIEFPESDKDTGTIIQLFYVILTTILLVVPLYFRMVYVQFVGGPQTDATRRRVRELLELKDQI